MSTNQHNTSVFPRGFITNEANLDEIFIKEASQLGISKSKADHLFNLLPASVKAAHAVKIFLDSEWHYFFGMEFHLNGNSRAISNQLTPFVVSLVRATLVADRVLDSFQKRSWWCQLDRPAKHFDAIVEMLGVANTSSSNELFYEQAGLGIGSTKIDWLLKTENSGTFLLEVKDRPGQMAQEMMRVLTVSRNGAKEVTGDPNTDFISLFKSTASKFIPITNSAHIQGVLVFLKIKVPAKQFESFFQNELQQKFHFVAFGREEKEAGISVNLFATSTEIERRVLSVYGWHIGEDFTY